MRKRFVQYVYNDIVNPSVGLPAIPATGGIMLRHQGVPYHALMTVPMVGLI